MKLDFITAFYEPNPSPLHRNGYVCLPWLRNTLRRFTN
jgi:hypothetical protein